jgi:glycerol kinase
LDNVKGARKKAERGELAFGTVDTWLLWNLTKGAMHAADATNASRTMLFNIVKQEWDKDLLKLFKIPQSLLPVVKDNVADFGSTSLFGKKLIIGGMAGDQQAALIGQACIENGMVKSTYGTGCFALINIGNKFRASKNRLLTTQAYRLNGKSTYAIEGSIFIAGAAIQWLRDNLQQFKKSSDSEKIALSVKDNNGVYFVPAFTGLGAPYWEPEAKALITGLSRESSGAHIVRAALEAQGYQTKDLMNAMEKDSGKKLSTIRVDGGLVANNFMCQFLSDILDRPVEIPRVSESTAWGAACLAGLHVGVFKNLNDISRRWKADRRYTSKMDKARRTALYQGWSDAVRKTLA